jgi:DNA-directed RNA polymerase subunit RPC12/RpoP
MVIDGICQTFKNPFRIQRIKTQSSKKGRVATMPVRVRCPQCEKVVNAPEAARGKAVKCPECEARIPVPASDDEVAAKPARPAKPAEKSAEKAPEKAEAKPKAGKADVKKPAAKKKGGDEDDADFFGKLDLDRAEDRHAKVCPKCGAEVDEDDVECAACGIDLVTGGLGKAAKKARMKGPDPADFYPTVWKDSARFVRENFPLVINTWIIMMALSFITWLSGAAGIFFILNDHKPSFWFFRIMAWLLTAGMAGWFLTVSVKSIQFALEKRDVLDRTPFDSFSSMAMGFSWVLWCVAAAAPFGIITIPIYFLVTDNDVLRYGLIAGISLVGVVPLIPIVMAHRAMPVNAQMWASPLMWKTAGKNIGAVLFCCLVGFVTFLPVALIMTGDIFLGRSVFYPVMEAWGIKHEAWSQDVILGFAEFFLIILFGQSSTGATSVVMSIVYVVLWMIVKAISLFCITVWGFFMIRAVALFTYYNKKRLALIGEVKHKAYVAREKKYDANGDLIPDGLPPAVKYLIGFGATFSFYIVINVILYVSGSGIMIMPRWLAVIFKMAAPE